MAEQLKPYVDSHAELQQSVERAKREIADAVEAIEERDKSRAKAKSASEAKPRGKSTDESSTLIPPAADNLSLFNSKRGANDVTQEAQ
jgi:hypothetical protein